MPVKQSGRVKTNARANSTAACHVAGVVPVTFEKLWKNYPESPPYTDAKGRIPAGFENKCAIKMSKTLHNVGINMRSFSSTQVKPEGKAPTIGRIF